MIRPSVSFPRSAADQVRRYDVGAVSVFPLLQFHYRVDPALFFPHVADQPVDSSRWWWQAPFVDDGYLVIDMGGFLVRTPELAVLVDLGVGDGKHRPNRQFNERHDNWLDLLAVTGIGPADIDLVVYTHLHVDHVGNGTRLVGDNWQPALPRAKHLVTEAEFSYWASPQSQAELARLGDYLEDSVLPIREAGRLEFVAPDEQISPEIRLRPAFGHTPGNVCVEIESAGARAVFAGDMIHHALQLAHPDWSTDFCVDGPMAATARQQLLDDIADSDTLLFASHFPDARPGRVATGPDGTYTFEAASGVAIS